MFGGLIMVENSENIIKDIIDLKPVLWINPLKEQFNKLSEKLEIKYEDILDAESRLRRFAPLLKRLFPETVDGIIESDLVEVPSMKNRIEDIYGRKINGNLLLKCDSHLKVAGSVKARGGIYEVLKHAEKLAVSQGMISQQDDYSKMADEKLRSFFSKFKIAVGSTGNLGLSIGIMARALGFQVSVHMSKEAKQWKKDFLRSKGVIIIEHENDYSVAVEEGRQQCLDDSFAYFIDDENSKDLFLGYSVAALRLKDQLQQKGISIGSDAQLYVYLPCGVGGAPGGIAFGLKHVFGDNVHTFFAEPVHSPSMLLGVLTGRYNGVHVREYGIDNITEADGLAVGSPSGLVSKIAEKMLDGFYTIRDEELFRLLSLLKDSQNIKIEPSAAAGLAGPALIDSHLNAVHISWLTGGLFVPDNIYSNYYDRGRNIY
jgi:D-serine dehydratase